MHTLAITPLDPSDAATVRAVHEVAVAASLADKPADPPPSPRAHAAGLVVAWGGETPRTEVARDGDGRVVGSVTVVLPLEDNRHVALFEGWVHPAARRRGVGRALLGAVREHAARDGRTTLIGDAWDDSPGAAFLAAAGFTKRLTDVRRALFVRRLGADGWEERWAALLAEAEQRSAAYDLHAWAGPAPDDVVEDVAVLQGRMSDAPTDDLDWEDEVWSAERIRRAERRWVLAGMRMHTVVARRPGGELAGLTTVFVDPACPDYAEQGDTVVLPEHRGRRLGLRLKLAMLARLRAAEPQIERIDTWNAASNRHMIAVNEAIGCQVLDTGGEWQRRR